MHMYLSTLVFVLQTADEDFINRGVWTLKSDTLPLRDGG